MSDIDPIRKIRDQLAWVGPTGKTLGHVVLTRAEAEQLIEYVDEGDDIIEDLDKHAEAP